MVSEAGPSVWRGCCRPPMPSSRADEALPARSPRQCPAVAAGIGPGEQHSGGCVTADDLDAARPIEITDRLDRVAAASELRPNGLGKAPLDRQCVLAVMRPIGVLARHVRGPAWHLG